MTRTEKILDYLWLVPVILEHFYVPDREREDMISVGTIGLIKAVDGYDEARGARFTTYAAKCIKNEICYYYRRNHGAVWEVAIEDVEEMSVSPDCETEQEEMETLREALDSLEGHELLLLDLHYGFSGARYSQKKIAEQMGISQSTVSREEKKILTRLRQALECV